jgi:pimeloyl-ACP methyl ester carboxylesterase
MAGILSPRLQQESGRRPTVQGMTPLPYTPQRQPASRFVPVRGLKYHVMSWGDASLASPQRPPLVMVHGWMDVGASFQFVVDALQDQRFVIAPDWRGFGLSDAPGTDSYWYPDYLGDLAALLDAFSPGQPVDLVGHSMGGNVVMSYAGVRPQRIRTLVNLEGFGLPETQPQQAPGRLLQWLRSNVHQEGRRYDTLALVKRVTGQELSPQPLLRYLEERYLPLYTA